MAWITVPCTISNTHISKSETTTIPDDAARFASVHGSRLANAIEAASDRAFVKSIHLERAIVASDTLPKEEGWYWVNVNRMLFEPVTFDAAKGIDDPVRAFVHKGAIEYAKRGLPIVIHYGRIGGRTLEYSDIIGLSFEADDNENCVALLADVPQRIQQAEDVGVIMITSPRGEQIKIDVAPGYTVELKKGIMRR